MWLIHVFLCLIQNRAESLTNTWSNDNQFHDAIENSPASTIESSGAMPHWPLVGRASSRAVL